MRIGLTVSQCLDLSNKHFEQGNIKKARKYLLKASKKNKASFDSRQTKKEIKRMYQLIKKIGGDVNI